MMECIVNDHYHTDLPLLHPPIAIATAAVFLALTTQTIWSRQPAPDPSQFAEIFERCYEGDGTQEQPSKLKSVATWAANSELDMEAVAHCVQLFISFYHASAERYDDQACQSAIFRAVCASKVAASKHREQATSARDCRDQLS